MRTQVKNFLIKSFILGLIFSFASCASNTPRENQLIGATAGGAAGAGLGAASGPSPGPITLVGIGAIVGALIGSTYGNYMENSDKEKALKAIATGQATRWQNQNTRVSYTIVPASNCIILDGNPHCRQFTAIQTTANGNTQKIFRTACQGARGDWQLAS